jgi:hypothetical protein
MSLKLTTKKLKIRNLTLYTYLAIINKIFVILTFKEKVSEMREKSD